MLVTREISISDFTPWSGAVSTWDRIIEENKEDEFDSMIDELYPDGISETQLNDLLWFDSDWVFEMLGISDDEDDDEDDEEEEEE